MLCHRKARQRCIFELLADVALQIRPNVELHLAFFFNLSYSATQSAKYSRRNDWRSEYCSSIKNPIVFGVFGESFDSLLGTEAKPLSAYNTSPRRIQRRFLHTHGGTLNWGTVCPSILELHPVCSLVVWPVSVSYRPLSVGIFGTVLPTPSVNVAWESM